MDNWTVEDYSKTSKRQSRAVRNPREVWIWQLFR